MMNLEKFSKAFSDKNRIKIIDYLTAGQKNVSEIADRLNVEENLASHHLRVLASLGFLKSDKKGREVFYRLNETKFITLIKDLKKNSAFKDIFLKSVEEK
jgi:ArsR family transcriptional regulator, arsenate/arsenite/antimonite-responsive transcriptional repressor